MDLSRIFVLATLVVFIAFFLAIILFRSFFLISRKDERRRRLRRTGTMSTADSTIDHPCTTTSAAARQTPTSMSTSTTTTNPPGYFSDVMTTHSSALYPVFVPSYASPLMSLRDPRQFQGLPGLAAPPPYPPPPSYSQIHNFPELPSASHDIVDVAQQPRITKNVDDVTPVE